MANYVKQPNPYSCGPTAILNALKWAGLDVTLQQFPLLEYSCRTSGPDGDKEDDEIGILDHDFDRVLRWSGKRIFKKIKRKKYPTFKEIKKHLQKGGSICLGYYWIEGKQSGGHYAFLSGIKNGLIEVINDHSVDDKINLRTDKTIRKWMKSKKIDAPIAWFLTN